MDKRFVGVFDDSMLQNMEEFDKRYLKTYIWVEIDGDADYWYYSGTGWAKDTQKLILYHPTKGNLFVSSETNIIIDIKLPDAGMFNHPGVLQACLFSRKPYRQWKRGLCKENSLVEGLYTNVYNKQSGFRVDMNCATLKAALDKNHVSIDEAVKKIMGKHASVAVGSMYAISKPSLTDDDRPCLWLYRNIIGFLNLTEKTIQPDPMYKQEVVDLLQGTGWKLH